MSDDFTEIENALRNLRPRTPSEFCQARVALALDRKSVPFYRGKIFAFAAALALCVASVPFLVKENPVENTAVLAENKPTIEIIPEAMAPAAQRTFGGIEPLEIQQAPDGRYFRPYRVHYLNTTQTQPVNSNVTLIKSIPEEEVQFIPVDMI